MNIELIIIISIGVLFGLILKDGLNYIIDQIIKFLNTEKDFNKDYKRIIEADKQNRPGEVLDIKMELIKKKGHLELLD